jgi:hypothetical protein
MMLWNWLRDDQTVEVYATGREGRLLALDEAGQVQTNAVQPDGGRYKLLLPGTTNRNNPGNHGPVMAGRPVILVERDTYAPFRAEVLPLPETSPADVHLSVSAADGGTGVGTFRVWYSISPPSRPEDWQDHTAESTWPALPLAGAATLDFAAELGKTYYFAAQARDRAGNWTQLPNAAQARTRIAGAPGPTAAPTASASASPSPQPSTTPTPGPSPTPGPVVGVLFLPDLAAGPAPQSTVTPVGEPGCRRYEVGLYGPRGEALVAPGARWWLRAVGPGHEGGSTFAVPAGQPLCVDPPPERASVWGEAPFYLTFPPQDPQVRSSLFLAVAPNALVNGTFEAGLAGWATGGSAPPQPTTDALSGAGAAVFGVDFAGQPDLGGGGNSTLGQDVWLPADGATLSLEYRLDTRPVCAGGACRYPDRLEVIVVSLQDPALPATYLTAPDGITRPTAGWQHVWFDLGPWSGQQVRLLVNLYQSDAVDPSRAWVDNVAIGPTNVPGR